MLVSQIVNRALRLLQVIDVAGAPSAVDAQTAIVALNAMCTRWEANGLAMGWANVAVVDDTLPAPDEAEDALAYNLAVRLSPEYTLPAAFEIVNGQARMFLADLRRDRLTSAPLKIASDLPRGRGSYWNIYNDEPA